MHRAIDGVRKTIPPAYSCRGVYFSLAGRVPFRHLVYPVPPSGGLGVHVTLDLAGQARFDPGVECVSAVDYTVDPTRADVFCSAIRTCWPELRNGALQLGYAGIRPKISGPKEPAVDFVVQGPEIHGRPGLGQSLRRRIAWADGIHAALAEQVLRPRQRTNPCGREAAKEGSHQPDRRYD